MDGCERKVLVLLSRGLTVDEIVKGMSINEGALADAIINLEEKGFVKLEGRKWILTEKGEKMLKEKEEELKRLKIEYIHGRINKEEYNKRKEEIEGMLLQEVPKAETVAVVKTLMEKEAIKKIYCPKCGAENKVGYNYCRICGVKLK